MELVLGRGGSNHIDAHEIRALVESLTSGTCILHGMEPAIVNANMVRISAGGGLIQGGYFRTDAGGESVAIDNGTQGMYRHDLICIEYVMDSNESAALSVVKGNPSKTPQDPSVSGGDINSGSPSATFPFFRARLNGLSLEGVDAIVPSGGSRGVLYPGDTVSARWAAGGYVTSEGREICFTIPLSKLVDASVSSVTVTGRATVRQNGNYLLNDYQVNPAGFHPTITPGGVFVYISQENPFANVSNNDACGVDLTYTLTFG